MGLKKRIGIVALAAVLTVTMSGVSLSTATAADSDLTPEKTVSKESTNSAGNIVKTSDGAEYVENEVIVVTNDAVTEKQAEKIANQEGDDLESVETLPGEDQSMAVVDTGKTDVEDAIEAYEERGDVAYAQPNYVYRKASLLTKGMPLKMYNGDFASTDNLTKYQWALKAVDAEGAWSLLDAHGVQKKAKVAVIDTGLYANHSQFQGLIASTWYDATKKVNGVWGHEYKSTDKRQSDVDGHGTHVSGIIAAKNDEKGTNGVAAGTKNNYVQLTGVGVFYFDIFGSYATTNSITRGIKYCTRKGVDVINMSLGVNAKALTAKEDKVTREAISNATKKNITIVCAAGNDCTDSVVEEPAKISDCISVSNVGSKNLLNESSTYGSTIDIAAPGTDILSTFPFKWNGKDFAYNRNAYISETGTSMSSPMVAGIAAMLYASDKTMTPAKVKKYLYGTTTDLYTAGKDTYTGYGMVNAKRALEARYTGKYVKDNSKRISKVYYMNLQAKSVTLKWQAVNGASSYSIQKRVNGAYKTIKTVDKNTTKSKVSGLTCGQKYIFRVLANKTETQYLDPYRASIIGNRTITTKPAAPKVTLKRYKDHRIKVSWTKVSGATEYRVYRAFSANGKYEYMDKLGKDTFSRTFEKVSPGKTYYYKVRAVYKSNGKTVYGNMSQAQTIKAL